jgi:predicted PurR-regulated permease PerM
MKPIIAFVTILLMFVLVIPANAGGKGELQKHFNNIANKVKATENASEKRAILENSFKDMSEALDKVQNSFLVSKEDQDGINTLKATLKENQDELAGINGFERVPDSQLNNFSSYVVQNMEQADETVTISVVALVLIILLVVLLF